MSWLTFIASDFKLENVENPHIKRFSVNEALAKGISVPKLVLDSVNIDRNEPNLILWIDDEENLGEIIIHEFEKTDYFSNITKLKYCSTLEWNCSESRSRNLIKYIHKHLEIAHKVEIWKIWNGYIENEPTKKQYHIHIKNLKLVDLKKMSQYDYNCIVVYQS